MRSCLPVKNVVLKPKDPPFINPLIKALLNKQYGLRRAGKTALADELAGKINSLIASYSANRYATLSNSKPKTLWREIRDKMQPTANNSVLNKTNPDVFNRYFASVSYDSLRPIDFSCHASNDESPTKSITPLEAFEVQNLLSRIKNTAPGLDNLPAWVFRNCSFELAEVITKLINQFINAGMVPESWLTAIVTPVPKVDKPSVLADYRPISVTPLLSRLTESIIVKKYVQPSIADYMVSDQYAFRPTGSTTCALVHIMHVITSHLENCEYVRCVFVDFTKCFDVVDQPIL